MAIRIDTGKTYRIVFNDGSFYTLTLNKNCAKTAAQAIKDGGLLTFYDSNGWVSLCVNAEDIQCIVRDDLR